MTDNSKKFLLIMIFLWLGIFVLEFFNEFKGQILIRGLAATFALGVGFLTLPYIKTIERGYHWQDGKKTKYSSPTNK